MTIPTEPIGSIPRPIPLIRAVAAGEITDPNDDPLYEAAVKDTNERYEATIRLLPDCLASLGPSARQALDFKYHAKLRLSEIGERLHRSEGAVKLLMFRARQALKHCIDTKLGSNTEAGNGEPVLRESA